ncbi:MAG: hypothetical protein AAF937_09035 [Planctomycetota bacterium]
MPHTTTRLATALLSSIFLGGCAATGSPVNSIATDKIIDAATNHLRLQANIDTYNCLTASDDERLQARNLIIDNGMLLINARYQEFVDDFVSDRKVFDTTTEITAVGLSTAAAVFTPATTVRILSALSAGVVASNASFNKNFYYEQSTKALIAQMTASRRKIEVDLLTGRSLSVSDYSLPEALIDLGRYYRAGTFEGAFAEITESAGTSKQADDKRLKDRIQAAQKQFAEIKVRRERLGSYFAAAPLPKFLDAVKMLGVTRIGRSDSDIGEELWIILQDKTVGFPEADLQPIFPAWNPASGPLSQDMTASFTADYAAFDAAVADGDPHDRLALAIILASYPEVSLPDWPDLTSK